ncbi:MAG: SH3 domain-containing protein [Bacteroidota bacterium]
MRKSIVLLGMMLWAGLGILQAQMEEVLIAGDQVELRESPSLESPIIGYVNWETEATGIQLDETWSQVEAAGVGKGYVLAWFTLTHSDMNSKAWQRITPSASTLYRMMRYFKRKNNLPKAEEFALRILNVHNYEEFPTEDQACFKLGHLAYIDMLSPDRNGVEYNEFMFQFSGNAMKSAEDPGIKAMALYHQARYLSLNGNQDQAIENLLTIVKDYPSAFSRNECQPKQANSWFYKPERTKRLFCALCMIQPPTALEAVKEGLTELTSEEHSAETIAMAEELLANIGLMPYDKDTSVWY